MRTIGAIFILFAICTGSVADAQATKNAAGVSASAILFPPWVIRAQEPVCSMSMVLEGDHRIVIEYHPRTDSYHMILGGAPWRSAQDGQKFRVNLSSGQRTYDVVAQTVRQQGLPSAAYLPLSDKQARQRPRPRDGSYDFIEGSLKSGVRMVIAIDGKQRISFNLGQSRKALTALALCSDRFVASRKSRLSSRLRPFSNVM